MRAALEQRYSSVGFAQTDSGMRTVAQRVHLASEMCKHAVFAHTDVDSIVSEAEQEWDLVESHTRGKQRQTRKQPQVDF